jgi:hypothetical protein
LFTKTIVLKPETFNPDISQISILSRDGDGTVSVRKVSVTSGPDNYVSSIRFDGNGLAKGTTPGLVDLHIGFGSNEDYVARQLRHCDTSRDGLAPSRQETSVCVISVGRSGNVIGGSMTSADHVNQNPDGKQVEYQAHSLAGKLASRDSSA